MISISEVQTKDLHDLGLVTTHGDDVYRIVLSGRAFKVIKNDEIQPYNFGAERQAWSFIRGLIDGSEPQYTIDRLAREQAEAEAERQATRRPIRVNLTSGASMGTKLNWVKGPGPYEHRAVGKEKSYLIDLDRPQDRYVLRVDGVLVARPPAEGENVIHMFYGLREAKTYASLVDAGEDTSGVAHSPGKIGKAGRESGDRTPKKEPD